jgi:hypothetical protein
MNFLDHVFQNNRRPFQSVATLRLVTSMILLTTSICSWGQELVGNYAAYYGHTLQLRKDSTFRYEWQFDLASSWSVGKWRVEKGIVYLNIRPVLDTLARDGQPDSLVLSVDEKSTKIHVQEFVGGLLSGGGQGRSIERIPDRLEIRGKRLHPMNKSGKIDRRRESGLWNNRKRPIYYVKTS